jgi:hypothetical protein
MGDIAKSHLCPREIGYDIRLAFAPSDSAGFAGECHHLISPLYQLFHNKASDVPSGSEYGHPHLIRRSFSKIMARVERGEHVVNRSIWINAKA